MFFKWQVKKLGEMIVTCQICIQHLSAYFYSDLSLWGCLWPTPAKDGVWTRIYPCSSCWRRTQEPGLHRHFGSRKPARSPSQDEVFHWQEMKGHRVYCGRLGLPMVAPLPPNVNDHASEPQALSMVLWTFPSSLKNLESHLQTRYTQRIVDLPYLPCFLPGKETWSSSTSHPQSPDSHHG